MRQKEVSYKRSQLTNELSIVWRRMLIEWMFFVVDFCNLQKQSVAAASYFLDVAMSHGLCTTREEHQLAAATSLQLSLKTFDTAVIKLDKLVKLGRGQFTEDDVATMEMKIISTLKWNLHPPSTYCFLRQYELLLPSGITDIAKEMIHEVTKQVATLTVLEEQYLKYNPSVLGYATLLLAFEMISVDVIPIHVRQCFMIRMSNVAKLSSSTGEVVQVVDLLRESFDNCGDKYQQVINMISSKTDELMSLSSLFSTQQHQ